MSGHHHPTEASGRIRAAFFLNLSFTVIEVVGGALVGSVAIVADAVHDLGDTLSLGVALVLEKYAQKRPDRRFSYGYRRISALSALITGVVLLAGSVYIVVAAVERFREPQEPLDRIKSIVRDLIMKEGKFHVTIEVEFDTESCLQQCDREPENE